MLDERRLQIMLDLARFEQIEGKEDLRIMKYYRKDYISFAVLGNFFQVTIGYFLILGLFLLYNVDFLMDNFNNLRVRLLLMTVIIAYVAILLIYTVMVAGVRAVRYRRAEKRVREYADKMLILEEMYMREDRKQKTDKRSMN